VSLYGLQASTARYLHDRCTITRGTYPDHAVVASNVPCQMRPASSRGTQEYDVVNADTVTVPLSTIRISASQDVARNDVVEVTTSEDGLFAGRYFTVVSVNADSMVTTRLVTVRETQT